MATGTSIGLRYAVLALVSVLVLQALAMGYSWLMHGNLWEVRALTPAVIGAVFAGNILFASQRAFAAGKRAGSDSGQPGSDA
jgi:hypothetical protein